MRGRSITAGLVPSGNPVVDRKLEVATEGLPPYTRRQFFEEFSKENQIILAEFLIDFANRENPSNSTKRMYVCNLLYLCRHLKHKHFKDITRQQIQDYLATLHRPLQNDPFQKWINTHNNRLVLYQKFFKWFYSPELTAKERPVPKVVRDLPLLKRKEKTHVRAQDLWTVEDDALFLKYCQDPRVALYHMFSLDTSARPHEILATRIGDVRIKLASGKMYAEVEVGRGGKTKSRIVPLIVSLPYYKLWLQSHPESNNPNAFIFRSVANNAKFRNAPLKPNSINNMYWKLQRIFFPKLLERPDVSPEEKLRIKELLAKPWNPYIRRHTSLTEKAKLVNEYQLRLHAGWTKTSKMVEIYTHELGGESTAALLEAYGIFPKESQTENALRPKQCPNCNEVNKPEARFCMKCRMILTFDAYDEAVQNEKSQMDLLMDSVSVLSEKVMKMSEELRSLKASGITTPQQSI